MASKHKNEMIKAFELNGGLVGAMACIEGTGRIITGTRNDEVGPMRIDVDGQPPSFGNNPSGGRASPSAPGVLALHSVRDKQGCVLGLGGGALGMGEDGMVDAEEREVDAEPRTEVILAHGAAVTGMDVVKGYGAASGRPAVSAVVTSGGDGCLRLVEVDLEPEGAGAAGFADDEEEEEEEGDAALPGPSMGIVGQIAVHGKDRATGVSATRHRAVSVGEDGCACLVDLERLDGVDGQGQGGVGAGMWNGSGMRRGTQGRSGVVWRGQGKGALPLSGVTFQGESDQVFATTGCDPRAQLMVWDTRESLKAPVSTFGCVRQSIAPYLCVTSQPFNPQVFACGVSTGEVLLWDVRTKEVMHELPPKQAGGGSGGTWGVAFHPRRPRHLFMGTGAGVLTKWLLPAVAAPRGIAPARGGLRFGSTDEVGVNVSDLYSLPCRMALVGVCYDEAVDTVTAVSRHGHLVVGHGIRGLRL